MYFAEAREGPNNIKYHKPCFSCLLCNKILDSHFAERNAPSPNYPLTYFLAHPPRSSIPLILPFSPSNLSSPPSGPLSNARVLARVCSLGFDPSFALVLPTHPRPAYEGSHL